MVHLHLAPVLIAVLEDYISKEEITLPVGMSESISLTAATDAQEGRDVMTEDVTERL
jgi:hypothetical protein